MNKRGLGYGWKFFIAAMGTLAGFMSAWFLLAFGVNFIWVIGAVWGVLSFAWMWKGVLEFGRSAE